MHARLEESSLADLPSWMNAGEDVTRLDTEFQRRKGTQQALAVSMFVAFAATIRQIVALSLISYCSAIALPMLLRQTIVGLEGSVGSLAHLAPFLASIPGLQPNASYALCCSVLLFTNSLVSILVSHHIFYIMPNFGARCRAALGTMIFDKALRQQRYSDHETPSGFIVNLLGSDTMKVQAFFGFMHSSWIHPLILMTAIGLLYLLIGAPALMGASSLALLLVTSIWISKKQTSLRRRLSKVSDRRIGRTHESLLHIRAAKFQGWERNLARTIEELRTEEVSLARGIARLTAVNSFASNSAPALAMAITCTAAVLQGKSLDAATIFPMLSLFMLLRYAMSNLPTTLFNIVEARVSLQRIQSFLELPDYRPRVSTPHLSHSIEIRGADFRWSEDITALRVPELTVAKGELIVVVGSVGSGKSALLLGLLGELHSSPGSVTTNGSVGYVAQTPWITSDSIRGNITCGLPADEERYQRALEASALTSDLDHLPDGDRTVIGERGINLSGGQRQRVALARALYAGADMYLLDDPLSALDPRVANEVFQRMICHELRGATRILVSHRVEFALRADRVVVIEGGRVLEVGTPAELSHEGTRFYELLHYHSQITGNHHAIESLDSDHPEERGPDLPPLENEECAVDSLIVAEERRTGAIERRAIRDYTALLAPGLAILTLLGLFVARQGAALSADLWLARASHHGIHNIGAFIGTYLSLVLMLCVFAYLRAVYLLTRGLAAAATSHDSMLRAVLHAPMRFFESNPVGRILNRFSNDLATIELNLPNAILEAGHSICETISVFLVVVVIAPIMLIIVGPVCAAYFLLQSMYRPIYRESQRLYAITLSPIFALLSESLSGVETIRSAQLTESFHARFVRLLNAHNRVTHTQIAANRWLGIRLEAVAATLILAVGVFSSLSLDSALSVGFAGLLLSYASSMTGTMNWAIRCISIVESNLTSFERIDRYAQTPSERLEGKQPPDGWPTRGEIHIASLTVRYRPELPPALNDIECSIPGGSRVGIVGRSGSGKSTMILAIMRLLEPASGFVEVDGISLSDLSLVSVRNSLAVVPQEPVLFSGALRESLDPFNQYSDEEIVAAIQRVQLGSFFESLPHGLQTQVREGGANFSCGQRQLICLARALLRKSRVIILDEATAAIDVETDYAIQHTIREEFRSSTVLVIAHRLGTVIDSDLILVLENGWQKEFGSPQQLLTKPGSLLGILVREMRRSGSRDA